MEGIGRDVFSVLVKYLSMVTISRLARTSKKMNELSKGYIRKRFYSFGWCEDCSDRHIFGGIKKCQDCGQLSCRERDIQCCMKECLQCNERGFERECQICDSQICSNCNFICNCGFKVCKRCKVDGICKVCFIESEFLSNLLPFQSFQ